MEGGSHRRESYLAVPFTYHHVAVTFPLRGAMAPPNILLGVAVTFIVKFGIKIVNVPKYLG